MADKRFCNDDDEEDILAPKEPQVTSDKPEERKIARALRIKKRQEALKKLDQAPEEVAAEELPGPIEQATASAAEELQRLQIEGNAKVTNVKVTADEREVNRRYKNIEKNKEFLLKIEEEANEAQLKYEVISNHWESVLKLSDPLDIDAEIQEQRTKCNDLMDQKNALINQLKDELKHMDEMYCEDLEKQDQDIKELSERVEKQVTIMQRAYEAQLFLIETAISSERDAMVEHNQKRWDALYKQRDKEEVQHMEFKFDQIEEFDNEIDTIGWDHHEKYRQAKMELEALIQELQKELEKLKAVCLINGEKIGYNYQVLKKREEENVFVRSQQKRKLNKMADVMNALRKKIRKAAEDGAIEEARGDVEIVKLKQSMADLENKAAHFAHVNNYKFSQVWRMNTARCVQLMRDVRRCEVAIHAHILAEPAPPPPPQPPKNPLNANTADNEGTEKNTIVSAVSAETNDNKMEALEAKENLVRHILNLVADNTGFLVENRLHELLAKYPSSSKTICCLDAIFNALEIHRDQDISLLCSTFLKYAFCPICMNMDDESQEIEITQLNQDDTKSVSRSLEPRSMGGKVSQGLGRASMRARSSARSVSPSTSRSTHTHITFRSGYDTKLSESDQVLMAEAGEILKQYTGPIAVSATGPPHPDSSMSTRRTRGVTVAHEPSAHVTTVEQDPFLCPMGHTLEIEPMQVLAALGDFVNSFTSPEKEKLNAILDSMKPRDCTTPSRKLAREEIEDYWNKFRAMLPESKDKFWNGLLTGLSSYLPVLQEREKLHDQVVELRRRNYALRRLLRGSLPDLPQPRRHKYLSAEPVNFTAAKTLPHV